MPGALAELAQRPQWVAWRYEYRPGEPKPTKVPYNARTGAKASTTDPSTWSSHAAAVRFAEAQAADGIGYVLSADDPYTGIDLDHCRDPESGGIEPWAKAIIRRLMSYTEISPSGAGIRIFVRGELPPHGRRKGPIECYSRARFLTVTGSQYGAASSSINDRQEELLAWHREVFGEAKERTNGTTVHAAVPNDLNDLQLLEKAQAAANGANFRALWNGDYSSYASQSEGDLALANYLAFWAGPDPARIYDLIRLSGLMREKWDRDDYRQSTIGKALEGRTDYYDPRWKSVAQFGIGAHAGTVEAGPQPAPGVSPIMTAAEVAAEVPERLVQLVEHLIWRGRTHWLYSHPGAGKSLLELAVLLHMAAGRPFHGLEVVPGAALVIEEDSPQSVIGEYLRMLAEIYGIELDSIPLYFNRMRGVRLSDRAHVDYVRELVTRCPQKPAVCLIDACERLVPSEHFNSKELDALAQLLSLNLQDGISNVVIDHTRKAQPAAGEKVELIEMLYGGRTKSAISDVMMFLSGAIKTRATMMFPKFRGEEPTPVHLSFDGAAGFTIKTGLPKVNESEREVMLVLNNAFGRQLSREEIESEAKLTTRTAQRALNKLVDIGWVLRIGDNRDAKYAPTGMGGGVFQ